jgi:integrase
LHWEDVDWDARTLFVRHSLQRLNGKLTRTDLKTKLSKRRLRMPGSVYAALKTHQARQKASGMVTPWVFATFRGIPIDARNLLRDFKKMKRKAGIPANVLFHDLRHTTASLLLAEGSTVKEVAELLGHSSTAMVNEVYSHVLPHRRDALADRMDAMLGA